MTQWKVLNTSRFTLNFVKRHYSDKIIPATDYISWDARKPVKIRMENSTPGNYPPILVQTMMRNTVAKYGNETALVSYDGKIKWTFQEYERQVQKAAKGFLSLGLRSKHGVGIMAHNQPAWHISSLAAIYAGGLSSGIYITNGPNIVKYICEQAPLDLLIFENDQLYHKMIKDEPVIQDIVKNFILLDESAKSQKLGKNVLTWNEMMESGNALPDEIIDEKEKEQAVNDACMLIYTSGTTGLPKGKTSYSMKVKIP